MNSVDRLVYMANQIARNLQVHGEAEAVAEMTSHLRDFWDPRMRALITAHVASGADDLAPIARAAVGRLDG